MCNYLLPIKVLLIVLSRGKLIIITYLKTKMSIRCNAFSFLSRIPDKKKPEIEETNQLKTKLIMFLNWK